MTIGCAHEPTLRREEVWREAGPPDESEVEEVGELDEDEPAAWRGMPEIT